jgi:RNA polymerase sigma factor (sigma-70 family)
VFEAHPDSEAPDPGAENFPAAVDVVQLYFEDAIHNGNSSLLSHEQEIHLAKAIEAGHKAATRLSSRRPTNGRTQALEDEVREGQQARERLITANLRLVVSVASWYRTSSIPLADLIQEGNIGLMHAADKYDWRRGTRFSTYAVWWIRQAIARSLANDSRLIRLPVHAHQKLALIARTKGELYHDNQADPSPDAIAEHAGLPQSTVRDLLPYLSPPTSLEAPIEIPGGPVTTLAATIQEGHLPSTENQAAETLTWEALQAALDTLTPREEQLLARRYGLRGTDGLSPRAAGQALGITKGRAQVIETNALAKLRATSDVTGI